MKKSNVFIFLIGILIGGFVSFGVVSFINSEGLLNKSNIKENDNEFTTIYFDDDNDNNSSDIEFGVSNKQEESFDSSYEDANENASYSEFVSDPVAYFENISKSDNENVIKNGFVTIVDFIFYGTEINGYSFEELTTEAKLKVMKCALAIDSKIDSYFPGYKETISNGAKNIYTNVKGFVVELYLDTTYVICENNESVCNNAKEDFEFMKKSFGLTWDFIKSLAGAGIDKLQRWYEVFRG